MSLEHAPQRQDNPGRILDDYLTRQQLAFELDISVRTLARLDAAREGPPSMCWAGRRIYHRDRARQWFESRLVKQMASAVACCLITVAAFCLVAVA